MSRRKGVAERFLAARLDAAGVPYGVARDAARMMAEGEPVEIILRYVHDRAPVGALRAVDEELRRTGGATWLTW